MNKSRIKQAYLLTVIISGIIALSVYSTYAIFTLESSTSNILDIHTPDTLNVVSNISEYKQVSVPKNSYIKTDIDIYNNFSYDLCYSIWYTIVNNDQADKNKIKIYQNTENSLTTTSTISSYTSQRIPLVITNDNDTDIKVNIGLSHSKNEGTCELDLGRSKSVIGSVIGSYKNLSEELIKTTQEKNNEAGYLTYKDIETAIELNKDSKYYVSDKFTYQNESFTLTEPKELELEKLNEYQSNDTKKYYTCLNDTTCEYLYLIVATETIENKTYKITKHDILKGYLGGKIGLRKIDNDYYYYGDNPNNYIYYNCKNENDLKSCELWRIIGFTFDEETRTYYTKIIRNDMLEKSDYNKEDNNWHDSVIAKYLEKYKLSNDYLIKEKTFKIENLLDLDSSISKLNDDNKTKIMLMNLSDYLNASVCDNKKISEYDTECFKNNWLNKNDSNEWTMTVKHEEPYTNSETNEQVIPANNQVYTVGNNVSSSIVTNKLNIRPVAYLTPRTFMLSGSGTFEDPYIIK